MKILVDTNVLVRLASPGDPRRVDAMNAMRTIVERGHIPCIVPQVLYEYWVVATRPRENNGLGLSVERVSCDLEKFDADFEFLADSAETFVAWLKLVQRAGVKGKPAHDARLVAAMLCHDANYILTFNEQDFQRFNGVVVVNPTDATRLPPAS